VRTVPADTNPDLWAERLPLEQLDPDGLTGRTRGLIVSVSDLGDDSFEGLLAVLACPVLDRVDIDRVVGRDQFCATVAVMRECRSRDIGVRVRFATELASMRSAWAHLISRPPEQPLRFDLYRRHGPGFVQVVDDRPDHDLRITFDDPNDIDLFNALDRPTPVVEVDGDRLAVLDRFDLVATVDDTAVMIVPRIKRWPIPLDDLFQPPVA
jgi:Family of unknown function (DUF5825)